MASLVIINYITFKHIAGFLFGIKAVRNDTQGVARWLNAITTVGLAVPATILAVC
jgi:ABC-type Fe3+ transport system permease subunit